MRPGEHSSENKSGLSMESQETFAPLSFPWGLRDPSQFKGREISYLRWYQSLSPGRRKNNALNRLLDRAGHRTRSTYSRREQRRLKQQRRYAQLSRPVQMRNKAWT